MTLLKLPVQAEPKELWVTQPMPAACPAVRSVAESYLSSRGLSFTPRTDGGFDFAGRQVKDGRGHTIRVTLSALQRYANDPPKEWFYPTMLAWVSMTNFELKGQLRLTTKESQCEVGIRHSYYARGLIWLVVLPVDGEKVPFDGNGRLEREYLSGIEAALNKSQ